MLRIAIVFITGLTLAVGYNPEPVEACGVKLTVKSPRVKKRVRRTSHPSHVLVLGKPPSKKLARWLKQAGHTVEITQNAKKTKRKKYAIVISDPEKVNEARSQFPKTRVVTRSGSLSSNVRKIERVLTKKDSSRSKEKTLVAAAKPRKSSPARKEAVTTTAKDPVETKKTVSEPVRPKKVTEPDDEPETDVSDEPDDKSAEPAVAKRPRAKKKARRARWSKHVFFGSNRDGMSRDMKKKLMSNVRWLAANQDVNVTIEGHTDASGPDEYNKLLGERRADAVRAFLVENGIDESRLEVVSYGEERPVYKSARKNRRVALIKN